MKPPTKSQNKSYPQQDSKENLVVDNKPLTKKHSLYSLPGIINKFNVNKLDEETLNAVFNLLGNSKVKNTLSILKLFQKTIK